MKKRIIALALCFCLAIPALSGCVQDIGEKAPVTELSRTATEASAAENTSAVIDIDDDEPEETDVPETETSGTSEDPVTEETSTHPEETESSIIREPQPTWTSETAPAETTPEETAAPDTSAPETEKSTTQAEASDKLSESYDSDYFANDLFIGDSIYTGISLYGFFSKNKVFAKVGLNPSSARSQTIDGYTAAQKAKSMKPKRIFIMLGTNGIAFLSASYMTEQMQLLVGELQDASPDSQIYIVLIPPVTYAHDAEGQETMKQITDYNSSLAKMCSENGISTLDLCLSITRYII